MLNVIEPALQIALTDCRRIGQIAIQKLDDGGLALSHRDDETRNDLELFRSPDDAIEIARYDDAGNYRPLKTAPNLRHRWRLELATLDELRRALDYFYPGRLAVFLAWKTGQLQTTPLRFSEIELSTLENFLWFPRDTRGRKLSILVSKRCCRG